eukprot:1138866-Pelagomonas_calceolata.AAC.4
MFYDHAARTNDIFVLVAKAVAMTALRAMHILQGHQPMQQQQQQHLGVRQEVQQGGSSAVSGSAGAPGSVSAGYVEWGLSQLKGSLQGDHGTSTSLPSSSSTAACTPEEEDLIFGPGLMQRPQGDAARLQPEFYLWECSVQDDTARLQPEPCLLAHKGRGAAAHILHSFLTPRLQLTGKSNMHLRMPSSQQSLQSNIPGHLSVGMAEAALLEAWMPLSMGWKRLWWESVAVPEDVEDEQAFRQQLKLFGSSESEFGVVVRMRFIGHALEGAGEGHCGSEAAEVGSVSTCVGLWWAGENFALASPCPGSRDFTALAEALALHRLEGLHSPGFSFSPGFALA